MLGGNWYGGPLMLVFSALTLVGIAILLVYVVRSVNGHPHPWPLNDPSATNGNDHLIDLAKTRLENGEITEAQFSVIKDALSY